MKAPTLLPRRDTPARKLARAILLGLLLSVPLFAIYLLNADRESQSTVARASIVEGWGGPQTLAGPFLVVPFSRTVERDQMQGDKVVKVREREDQDLYVAATTLRVGTRIAAERRRRSIYQAVVYRAHVEMAARFRLPDLAALNIQPDSLRLNEAELRVGILNAKGLAGSRPLIVANGRPVPLIPGSSLGVTGSSGFTGRLPLDLGFGGAVLPQAWRLTPAAGPRPADPLDVGVRFDLRGSDGLSVAPAAEQTDIRVDGDWPNPSFTGAFLPNRRAGAAPFPATWSIGNLALNRPTVSIGEGSQSTEDAVSVNLLDPVNLYSQVNRATKYGFMFIGFTFLALLMFDVIGGAPVPGVAYLLIGAGLILFFVLLLALAEVIGFLGAYLLAGAAIVGLIASYSAAILGSWRRAGVVAALLAGLYAILYVLLSLEAYSLLIGAALLFAALAGVMYSTRRVDWGRPEPEREPGAGTPGPLSAA